MHTGTYIRTDKIREKMSKAHTKHLFCSIEDCNNKHYGKGLCVKHYWRQYHSVHKERQAERCEQYRQNNKERIAKRMIQWRKDNPEYHVKYGNQYYQDNKDHLTEYKRQYYKTPAGKASMKAHKANRRAMLKGLTLAIVQRVYEANIVKYGQLTCCLCFKPIKFGEDSLEHLTPLTREGTNNYDNLGIAHLNCNIRKQAMTLEEWFNKTKTKKEMVI